MCIKIDNHLKDSPGLVCGNTELWFRQKISPTAIIAVRNKDCRHHIIVSIVVRIVNIVSFI